MKLERVTEYIPTSKGGLYVDFVATYDKVHNYGGSDEYGNIESWKAIENLDVEFKRVEDEDGQVQVVYPEKELFEHIERLCYDTI